MTTVTPARRRPPVRSARRPIGVRAGKPARAARISAEEFEGRYADVPFCELERGEVIHLTAGGPRHSLTSSNVAGLLREWARKAKRGRVLTNEAGLFTERDPDTVRGVDVMYYSYQRVPKGKLPDGFPDTPPELAVEIIGKKQGWNKMVKKAGEYLAMGTDRVWLVDPAKKTLHVFSAEQEPKRYEGQATIRDEAILPGFSCKLGEFFQD